MSTSEARAVVTQWDSAVRSKVANGASRQGAIRELVIENSELHARYVKAHNVLHPQQAAKFD